MANEVVYVARARVKTGTDKCPYFGDVTIDGFGKLLGCPVWKKDGKFRPGLPMRKGEKQSFNLIELEEPVEKAVFAALVAACEKAEQERAADIR